MSPGLRPLGLEPTGEVGRPGHAVVLRRKQVRQDHTVGARFHGRLLPASRCTYWRGPADFGATRNCRLVERPSPARAHCRCYLVGHRSARGSRPQPGAGQIAGPTQALRRVETRRGPGTSGSRLRSSKYAHRVSRGGRVRATNCASLALSFSGLAGITSTDFRRGLCRCRLPRGSCRRGGARRCFGPYPLASRVVGIGSRG